jgi:dienelactone hydrolase
VPALVLYGEDDTNVPSARSAARLRKLENRNIQIRIYEGSGHALESPIGEGDSIFRPDALRDLEQFILTHTRSPESAAAVALGHRHVRGIASILAIPASQ